MLYSGWDIDGKGAERNMTGDVRELRPEPQELDLIPLDHTPRQIIARGRHKRIRHKRERRDRCIYVICALIYAFLGLCVGFCGALAYFLWTLGVI